VIPAARTLAVPTTTTDQFVARGLWLITGWSFRETTALAGAVFELVDGSNADGEMFATISLVANESTRDLIPGNGLAVETGVFVNMISGSIRGAIWAVPADLFDDIGLARGVKPIWAG